MTFDGFSLTFHLEAGVTDSRIDSRHRELSHCWFIPADKVVSHENKSYICTFSIVIVAMRSLVKQAAWTVIHKYQI